MGILFHQQAAVPVEPLVEYGERFELRLQVLVLLPQLQNLVLVTQHGQIEDGELLLFLQLPVPVAHPLLLGGTGRVLLRHAVCLFASLEHNDHTRQSILCVENRLEMGKCCSEGFGKWGNSRPSMKS